MPTEVRYDRETDQFTEITCTPGDRFNPRYDIWTDEAGVGGGAGSGGSSGIATLERTLASLEPGASEDFGLALPSGHALLSAELSAAGWLRVYPSAAARTADAGRPVSQDPAVPVVLEVRTAGAQSVTFDPAPRFVGADGLFLKLTNEGPAAAVTVTLRAVEV